MALVHGKIYNFCVIFIVMMPTDGQHCAAGKARLEVWQVLLNESCGITFLLLYHKRESQVILHGLRESKDRLHIVSDVSAIWMKVR